MTERLLSVDPLSGIEEWHSYDSLTDTTRIISIGDCTPYIEVNKKMANDNDMTRQGIKEGMWLYASFPPMLQVQWLIEEGLDVYNRHHAERLNRKLADPEFRYVKTTSKIHKLKNDT